MYECFVSSRLAEVAILDLLSGRTTSSPPTSTRSTGSLPRCTGPRGSSSRRSTAGRAPPGRSRSKLLWVSIGGLLEGELSDPAEQRGLARFPLRALAIMGRGAS